MKTKKIASEADALANRLVGGKLSQMATYSDLFENMADAIFLIDFEGSRVLECNPSVDRMLGLSSISIQGDDLLKWVDPSSVAVMTEKLELLRQRQIMEKPFDIVFVNEKGQKFTLEISACRLKLADYCEVIQVIGRDVSELRKATQDLVDANHRLALLSNTDEMTGLYNFRYFKSELKKEHDRSVRYGIPYSIILCDIDHFKNYNDKNGHPAGDEALKMAASNLKERARSTDVVARYGGEEFVVLCPQVSAAGGREFAEAMRANIEKAVFPFGDRQPLGRVTISIGVGGFPEHGKTSEEVLLSADKALYHSKQQGRNRVSVFSEKVLKKTA